MTDEDFQPGERVSFEWDGTPCEGVIERTSALLSQNNSRVSIREDDGTLCVVHRASVVSLVPIQEGTDQ